MYSTKIRTTTAVAAAVICRLTGTLDAIEALVNVVVDSVLESHTSDEVITLVPAVLGVASARSSNWIVSVLASVEHHIRVMVLANGRANCTWLDSAVVGSRMLIDFVLVNSSTSAATSSPVRVKDRPAVRLVSSPMSIPATSAVPNTSVSQLKALVPVSY